MSTKGANSYVYKVLLFVVFFQDARVESSMRLFRKDPNRLLQFNEGGGGEEGTKPSPVWEECVI